MSLRQYPEYKDSGVEWLGDVPRHWMVKPLKRGLRLLTEKTDRRTFAVGLENIEGWSGCFLPSEADFEGDGVAFEQGDILFGKLRPYLAKVLLAPRSGEAVGDFHVMRPSAEVHGRFAQYQMLTEAFISIVDGSTFGAKMPRANWEFVGGMPFVFPTMADQSAIAAFLDRETGKIDALVAEQEKLIELLKEKRQAVISHAVTKGLDPAAPMKDSGVEWLGKVPAHWDVRRLKQIGTLIGGAGFPHEFQGLEGEELPFFKVADLGASGDARVMGAAAHTVSREIASTLRARIIPSGAVIYAKIGAALLLNRRRIVETACCIDNNMSAFVPTPDLATTPWSWYWLGVVDFGKVANPGAVPSLSEGDQSELPMLVPPIVEQQAIAAVLDRATSRNHALVIESERAIDLLKEHRSALISAAVTGKIDVRGLVETNPPARTLEPA